MFPRDIILGVCLAVVIGYFWNKKQEHVEMKLYWILILGAVAGHFPDFDSNISVLTENAGWAHRSQYTHSIFGLLVWPAIIAIAAFCVHLLLTRSKNLENFQIIYLSTFAAYLSHLFTDTIEDYPTPILYPFTTTPYFGFIPKNEFALPNTIIMIGSLFISAFFLYLYYWVHAVEPQLKSLVQRYLRRRY